MATYHWQWQQAPETDITVEETIEYWQTVLDAFWDDAACATGGNIPTPFWDEAQDLNDEATPEAQIWYGEVADENAPADEITFVENVGIWVITGFVAYAATPAAAIFFHTIAPRFVHAFHKGDVREIWRIVVDSADAGTVDTDDYPADAIIEFPVVADPDIETGHDIYLIQMSIP